MIKELELYSRAKNARDHLFGYFDVCNEEHAKRSQLLLNVMTESRIGVFHNLKTFLLLESLKGKDLTTANQNELVEHNSDYHKVSKVLSDFLDQDDPYTLLVNSIKTVVGKEKEGFKIDISTLHVEFYSQDLLLFSANSLSFGDENDSIKSTLNFKEMVYERLSQ